jgi:hypothetical protein
MNKRIDLLIFNFVAPVLFCFFGIMSAHILAAQNTFSHQDWFIIISFILWLAIAYKSSTSTTEKLNWFTIQDIKTGETKIGFWSTQAIRIWLAITVTAFLLTLIVSFYLRFNS